MVVLVLVRKDLLRLLRDRRALVINVLLPFLLAFIMGLSFGGSGGGISAIPVALVGDDVPTALRDRIVTGLEDSGYFTASWADSATAADRVRSGAVAAAVVLPPDLVRRFLRGDDLPIGLWQDPGSEIKAGIVHEILQRALARYQAGEAAYLALWPEDGFAADDSAGGALEDLLDGGFSEAWSRWRSPGGDPALRGAAERFLRDVDHNVALTRALQHERLVLDVHDKAAATATGNAGETNLFNVFLPSFAVLFLMFGVAAGARDLHRERDRGTLQRQLLGPPTALQFVLGKWLASGIQGVLQLATLFLAGALAFHMNLGPDAWSLAALTVLGAAAAAGLFVFLALVTPSEKVMDSLSTTIILVAALLGGNMVPVDSMPPAFHVLGRIFFNYWLNLGLSEVIRHDRSLAARPDTALVLAVFALVCLSASLVVFLVRRRKGGLA